MNNKQRNIVNLVVKHFDISDEELFQENRKRHVAVPRHFLMFLFREKLGMSYDKIGKLITANGKKRHHVTVMHGCQQTKNRIDVKEQPFYQNMEAVLKELKGEHLIEKNHYKLLIHYPKDVSLNDITKALNQLSNNLIYECL